MKVQLIAVGTKMPDWIQKGYGEYCKRLPKELAPKLIELTPGHRGKNASLSAAIEAEGKDILNAIGNNDFVIALEVLGKPWSTEQLASHLSDWRMGGQNLSFIIGGVIALFLLATKLKKMGDIIPFGPAIIISAVISFIWGADLWGWYLGQFGV